MPVTRSTVRLEHISGLAEDACINVWHFQHNATLDGTLALAIGDALATFYQALSSKISQVIARTTSACQVQHAVMDPGAAGPEDDVVSELLFTDYFTMGAPTGGTQPLPSEVAVCLSYRGDIAGLAESSAGGTIRPISRRRGRLFLGPWTTGVLLGGSNPYVDGAFAIAILDAYETCVEGLSAAPSFCHHVVYSPTTGQVHEVELAWVDEQFDTVRSRGARPTGKTTRVITQGP